jgi:hypothetical protein
VFKQYAVDDGSRLQMTRRPAAKAAARAPRTMLVPEGAPDENKFTRF